MQNPITKLFNIKYPIIQGGMVWCSGWELASAVSNSGGLGLLGAGSMHPETLITHIKKTKNATNNNFGVNVPLMYPNVSQIIDILIEQKVPVVFTSAGNPALYTQKLKQAGIKVAHVVANTKFAKKCVDAGVDAIVAEGFEAGGHNGREETTTICLIPQICQVVDIPVIAAGGIASGRAMAAAFALGASAVQIGSLFAASIESSAHQNFKNSIIKAREGDTLLALKKISPTRLLFNSFAQTVHQAEDNGATAENLKQLLGHGRAKAGMFEGDLENGELEIGQVSAMIDIIKPVNQIFDELIAGFNSAVGQLSLLKM